MGSEQPQDPFPISPCTIDDIDSLYAVYLAAFSLFEVHDLLYPPSTYDHEDSAVWFRKRVIQQLSQPEIHWFKITDASTGQVVAIARWGYPHVRPPKKEEEKTEELKKLAEASAWPKGTNVKLANAKFGRLGVWREKYIDWENTYIMYMLATLPSYHRKGLASRLLQHGLDIVDKDGKIAYIEASSHGYPLYQRFGFKEIDRVTLDLESWGGAPGVQAINYCMTREPKASGGNE